MAASAVVPPLATARPRRPTVRRAAVAVVSGLVAFTALQLVAVGGLELRRPAATDANYDLRLSRIQKARRRGHDPARTVVALGSSHVYNGLAADDLSATLSAGLGRPVSVVNAAFPACGPSTELFFWRRLRRDRVRPDLLLVEVSAGALTDKGAAYETSAAQMPTTHLCLRDLPLMERSWSDARPGLWHEVAFAEWVGTWRRCRSEVMDAFTSGRGTNARPAPDLLHHAAVGGWPVGPLLIPPDSVTADARARALEAARAQYVGALHSINPDGASGRAIRELLTSCREAGVAVALLRMPEGPQFRGWYSPEAGARLEAWVAGLGREFGAPVFDARGWMSEDDFVDSHHLLASGAVRFSERLGRECVLPWLRRRPDGRER